MSFDKMAEPAVAAAVVNNDNDDTRTRLVFVMETGDQKDFRDKKRNPYDRRQYLEQNVPGWVRVEMRNLSAGDYAILTPDERVLALIERKNMSDMLASIKYDGRYKSQSERMERAVGDVLGPLVYWLVVGAFSTDPKEQGDVRIVRSAMAHLNTLPHTKVVHVENNEQATLDWLLPTLRYLDEQQRGPMYPDLPQYERVIAKGERTRLDTQPDVWLEQMNVPRDIGRPTARAIVARYPSALRLIKAYARTARDYRPAPPAPPPAKGKGSRKRAVTPPTLLQTLDGMLAATVELGTSKKGAQTYMRQADSKRMREVMVRDDEIQELVALGDQINI